MSGELAAASVDLGLDLFACLSLLAGEGASTVVVEMSAFASLSSCWSSASASTSSSSKASIVAVCGSTSVSISMSAAFDCAFFACVSDDIDGLVTRDLLLKERVDWLGVAAERVVGLRDRLGGMVMVLMDVDGILVGREYGRDVKVRQGRI